MSYKRVGQFTVTVQSGEYPFIEVTDRTNNPLLRFHSSELPDLAYAIQWALRELAERQETARYYTERSERTPVQP